MESEQLLKLSANEPAPSVFETSPSMRPIGQLLAEGGEPIVASIDCQTMAAWYVMDGANPYKFNQKILAALRDRGAPIEGALHLKPAHGRIARIKNSPKGPGWFDYVWLPDQFVKALELAGGVGV